MRVSSLSFQTHFGIDSEAKGNSGMAYWTNVEKVVEQKEKRKLFLVLQ